MTKIHRRALLKLVGVQSMASLASLAVPKISAAPADSGTGAAYLQKTIPSTGQKINALGMGTWQTFNVGSDDKLRLSRAKVLKTFFEEGGELIDSSPMYGSAQSVLGFGLKHLGFPSALFSADKIWTGDGDGTIEDMQDSLEHWQLKQFTLMQIHNLLSWQDHLPKLQAMKKQGKLKYVGITTSHGRRHDELENIMRSEEIDFVQLTYNMANREVEKRLLPLALDKGIAIIANRPFAGGQLVDKLKRSQHVVPDWARELGCKNWPQFLLKFIISHPAVTCAIPATSKVVHMRENMGALLGPVPEESQRQDMLQYLRKLGSL